MNILIVDDQKAIVDNLKTGISWSVLNIEQVYTACSAKEAKLLLVNFEIDIILSDIEMPEEDGLELFRWTRSKFPDIECIFLTSHADFSYAKEAIKLGGFDYILQPARYAEIIEAIKKAVVKIKKTHKMKKLESTSKIVVKQRDSIMDSIASRLLRNEPDEANRIFGQFNQLFHSEYETCVFYPIYVQIAKWNRRNNLWDDKLVMLVFKNILEELFTDVNGKICVAHFGKWEYVILLVTEDNLVSENRWEQNMKEFFEFIQNHMDFSVSVYPGYKIRDKFAEIINNKLLPRSKNNTLKKSGIFWEDIEERLENRTVNSDEGRIQRAIDYIKANLSKNISRGEVANLVFLNEEYFSRLFKQETGYTFKDYELMLRMDMAQTLLEHSKLSVSIIASKVGYDNFSHFSKMFKKITDMTPQEYRKVKSQK